MACRRGSVGQRELPWGPGSVVQRERLAGCHPSGHSRALSNFVVAGAGAYPYMAHLTEFERRGDNTTVPAWLRRVATPLIWREWGRDLHDHPDPDFRAYILRGIADGFRVGFSRSSSRQLATSNMRSAIENAAVVREYLSKEISLGRIIGPIDIESVPTGTQISPLGVIPKSSQPGKWRLIVDLSSPGGRSVNDGIEPELCSLHYLRLDEVVERIVQGGKGTQLAKMDIESAYRMVPVHPQDRALLAIQWAGQVFFDTRLPFGLRSAPKIFTAMADALQWSFQKHGVSWVSHYLDDYITLGPPNSDICGENMRTMLAVSKRLGVPVAPAKFAGPTTALVFLGFELDTEAMIVRLPDSKLRRTLALVREWSGKRACRKRELESLLGHLQHAATVIRPGRTFVRRLIELLLAFENRDHWIRLNESTISPGGLPSWKAGTASPSCPAHCPCLSRWSPTRQDGGGAGPIGVPNGSNGDGKAPPVDGTLPQRNFFSVVVWGRQWVGRRLECLCDNMAMVAVINSGRSKDRTIVHLLRCLFFVSAHLNVFVHASHVAGAQNVAADALSSDHVLSFLQAVPEADRLPAAIPQALVNLTVIEQPEWTSPRWASLFSAFCRQV